MVGDGISEPSSFLWWVLWISGTSSGSHLWHPELWRAMLCSQGCVCCFFCCRRGSANDDNPSWELTYPLLKALLRPRFSFCPGGLCEFPGGYLVVWVPVVWDKVTIPVIDPKNPNHKPLAERLKVWCFQREMAHAKLDLRKNLESWRKSWTVRGLKTFCGHLFIGGVDRLFQE